MPRIWLNSCAYTAIPELSAWVDDPFAAFGQMLAAAFHEVHGTYRVSAELGMPATPGPNSAGTLSLVPNFISPNSCQVELSSWPAERKKTKSNWFATSPTSAR